MELFFGTTNPGKLRELRRLVAGLPVRVVSPDDLGRPAPEIVEDGLTFAENAAKRKATSEVISCARGVVSVKTPTPIAPIPVRRMRMEKILHPRKRQKRYAENTNSKPRRNAEPLKMFAVGWWITHAPAVSHVAPRSLM